MRERAERRLAALTSLSRKQSGDLEQARLANVRIRDALARAEAALRDAAAGVADVERLLRQRARPDARLSLDELTRWQLQLVAQREQLEEQLREKDQVAARLAEAAAWLARCAQSLEATERLCERTRTALAAEMRRRGYRDLDELWLVGGRGRS
jgi:hypothetical protein